MKIEIIERTHVRGVPYDKGALVEVSALEAKQFASSGHAKVIEGNRAVGIDGSEKPTKRKRKQKVFLVNYG